LLFIALFVWLGASQEASMVQMRSALAGIPVKRAMITDFRTLQSHEPLSAAVGHLVAGFQQDFPVIDDGKLVGIVTRDDLAKALAQLGAEGRISEIMQREFVTVSPNDMLQSAFAALQNCNCHTLPVVQDGRLLGMMTSDNLAEVLMIREALREANRRQRPQDGAKYRQSPAAPVARNIHE
jgi:predicted transcriptional regulator